MNLKLRPYQQRVIEELFGWFGSHPEGNPIVGACVGAGKSILIAEICRTILQRWPGQRILMVVASKELCEQNLYKLWQLWPQAPAGVHSASLGRSDTGHDIIYATIGSVWKKGLKLGYFDLVLVDEAHNINSSNTGMYRALINDLKLCNPAVRVIGWTGTPYRGNGIWLTDGEDALFTHIATRVGMRELLEEGYLTPLATAGVVTRTNVAGVEVRNGDFVISQLARAVDRAEITEAACEEIVTLGADRAGWLVFCVTVTHAEHVRDSLRRRGITAEMVSAKTPAAEREQIIRAYKARQIRCIVNVAVLTVGFDAPHTDLIALLRNTRSPVLYTQIAGRGMRCLGADIYESARNGKRDCLWLDFTDTTETLGPVDAITGRARGKSPAVASYKSCNECGTRCSSGARRCPECGTEFPFEEAEVINHQATASTAAIMSADITPQAAAVSAVRYSLHRKPGKPDSVKATYLCGLAVHHEWVCFGHTGPARQKAATWWIHRTPVATPVPATAQDALDYIQQHGLREPTAVTVRRAGKYTEVVGYEFGNEATAAPRDRIAMGQGRAAAG